MSALSFEETVKKYGPTMQALQTIRDKRLFREKHRTFEEYVVDKWGADMLTILNAWEEMIAQHN